jgi:hypothetical protein
VQFTLKKREGNCLDGNDEKDKSMQHFVACAGYIWFLKLYLILWTKRGKTASNI